MERSTSWNEIERLAVDRFYGDYSSTLLAAGISRTVVRCWPSNSLLGTKIAMNGDRMKRRRCDCEECEGRQR